MLENVVNVSCHLLPYNLLQWKKGKVGVGRQLTILSPPTCSPQYLHVPLFAHRKQSPQGRQPTASSNEHIHPFSKIYR